MEFDAVKLLWARSHLIETSLSSYLTFLDHLDSERQFSNFGDSAESFYQYHDNIALLENKVDYLQGLEKDLEDFVGKQTSETLKNFVDLTVEHYSAIAQLTLEDMEQMEELLAEQFEGEKKYEQNILKKTSDLHSSIEQLQDVKVIEAAIEGREDAQEEMD